MLTRKWTTWLGILLGLAAVGGGLYALLHFQGYAAAANAVSILATLAAGAWTLRGLYVWREVPWVRRVNALVITAFAFGLVYLILHASGSPTYAQTTLYLFGTAAGFMLGVNLLRLALQPRWPVIGVARAMIEEAVRARVAVVFIALLLVFLPVLMLILGGGDDRLTYIVQRFLTYSLIGVSFLLSTMTVLMGAYSTSFDLKSKQVYMTLVKPLSRTQYLLGKWLGLVLLNAVLLAVSGVAIAGFTRALAQGEAMNAQDREKVQREVLTARVAEIPLPREGTVDDMAERTLVELQAIDPGLYGAVGEPASALPEKTRQEVLTQALAEWFAVDPGETGSYRFTGLDRARQNADRATAQAVARLRGLGLSEQHAGEFVAWQNFRRPRGPEVDLPSLMTQEEFADIRALINREKVQLVLNPYTRPEPDDAMVELLLWVNGQPWPITMTPAGPAHMPTKVAADTPQEMSLPAWLISAEGEILLEIRVPPTRRVADEVVEQNTIQFNRKDDVPEVYFRVGTFEGNLAKSLGVLWFRLAFLAMFGLVLGSLFSFPVAALAGLQVYVIAAFSGYLAEAVTSYGGVANADTTWGMVTGTLGGFFSALGEGRVYEALKVLIGLIGRAVILLAPSFGEFNPGPNLSEGKVVPNSMLLSALLRIGLLWTGLVTVVGLLLFHRRELAKVTV